MLKILNLIALTLISLNTYAAKLFYSCAMNDSQIKSSIESATSKKDYTNGSPLSPTAIASVSKIFTASWLTQNRNLRDTYKTNIFISSNATNSTIDLHFEGSLDPTMNRFRLLEVFKKLNEQGITKINQLTFDENFKFLPDTDSKLGYIVNGNKIKPLTLREEISYPQGSDVELFLSLYPQYISEYNQTHLNEKKVVMSVSRIAYQDKNTYENLKIQQFKKISLESKPLYEILKAMNWNSNNYTANLIFLSLGGVEKFNQFLKQNNFSKSVKFYNGSGQNHALMADIKKGILKIYNQATCFDVTHALRLLHESVSQQKMSLYDVLPIIGVDITSTVNKKEYSSSVSNGVIAAKTGTVGTNVALAGVVKLKQGYEYFMINVESEAIQKVDGKIKYDETQEAVAKEIIGQELSQIIKPLQDNTSLYEYKTSHNPISYVVENYGETW